MSSNPFAALFNASEPSVQDAVETKSSKSDEEFINAELKRINNVIENIFGFTINKECTNKKALVFLQDTSCEIENNYLTVDCLGQALCERIMLDEPKDYVFYNGDILGNYVEKKVLIYLFNCFEKVKTYDNIEKICEAMKNVIIQNAIMCIQQPELFSELPAQAIELFKDLETPCHEFFEEIGNNWTEGMSFLY